MDGVRTPVTTCDWQRGFFQLAAELAYMQEIGKDVLFRASIVKAVALRGRIPPEHLLDVLQKDHYTVRWRDILITSLYQIAHVSVEDLGKVFDKSSRNIYRCIERGLSSDRRVIATIRVAIGAQAGNFHGAGSRLDQARASGGNV